MFELSFNSQDSGLIATPPYNHQGLSDYQDPLYVVTPANSSQLLPVSSPIIDTVTQSIDASKDILSGLSNNSQINYILNTSFGEDYQQGLANQILLNLSQNHFTGTPDIQLVSTQSFDGAYGKETNTIYLSQQFVAANNVDAITGVLLEEFGHYIDGQINVKDAAGDEGYIFSQLVRGQSISAGELVLLKGEDDTATININGKDTAVEQSSIELSYNAPVPITNMAAFNGNNNQIVVGDFNGDGKSDVIRQETGSWVDGTNDTQVYLSNGNGTFQNPVNMTGMAAFNGNNSRIITGDFNGDGKSDVIRQETGSWVDGTNDTQVYLSNGNGTFQNPVNMTGMAAFNGNNSRIITGDFNGDGKSDVIRQETGSWVDGTNDTQVYLSNGNGTFQNPVNMTGMAAFNGNNSRIITGDFNGDGKSDVIRQETGSWVDGTNDTQVYLSNGNGTFQNPVNMTGMAAFNGNNSRIITGDFNGDGKSDVIRQETGSWVDGINDTQVYLSNGNGTFQNPVNMTDMAAFNGNNSRIITGDFNGDGKSDVIRQETGSWVDGINDTQVYLSKSTSPPPPGLRTTDSDLNNLQQGVYDGKRYADNYGGYLGQCVSLVKKMTGNNATTYQWKKGANVITNGNVAVGTAIATFNGSNGTSYETSSGGNKHAAIFAGYLRDSKGNIIGFEAWNQNFDPPGSGVKKSKFYTTGNYNANSDADYYYAIQV